MIGPGRNQVATSVLIAFPRRVRDIHRITMQLVSAFTVVSVKCISIELVHEVTTI